MFDLPAAKRVRRVDLYSAPSSSPEASPDPELTALLHSRLENVYGPISLTDKQSSGTQPEFNVLNRQVQHQPSPDEPGLGLQPEKGKQEEGFEFRLFATSLGAGSREDDGVVSASATRIILDDDNDGGGTGQQGGFVVPRRDKGYYFTDALPPARMEERRREFEAAAVSGADVRRWAAVRYYGWEVRWRVKHLRMVCGGELVAAEEGEWPGTKPLVEGLGLELGRGKRLGRVEANWKDGRPAKKRKPGKKRRIVLRIRKKKAEEAAEQRRLEKERKMTGEQEREAAEREKRTRRNREKKVKKKLKEKEKKAQGQGAALQNANDDENSGGH